MLQQTIAMTFSINRCHPSLFDAAGEAGTVEESSLDEDA